MLTLNECKKILGIEATGKTDEQILQIRDWLYHMADTALDACEKEVTIESTDTKQLLISGSK